MRKLSASLLATALLSALLIGIGDQLAAAATISARSLLYKLTAASESGGTTYARTYFGDWIDADGHCQNTRAEVTPELPISFTSPNAQP